MNVPRGTLARQTVARRTVARRTDASQTAAMVRPVRYLAQLDTSRLVLWCYAIWYACAVVHHFDPSPRLWITSLGLSAIIGTALVLSTKSGRQTRAPLDRWVLFRLYLMPFCVSSFAALVKDEGYVLVFPPSLAENLIATGAIGAFVLLVRTLRRQHG